MEASTQADDEAQFECKHCGAEHDELEATECEESPTGFCTLKHADPHDAQTTDEDDTEETMTEDNTNTEDTDEWKTMSAEECKKEAGLKQVDGLVWEQADN